MTFYAATLVELLIIQAFVFFIWLKVLLEAVRSKDGTLVSKKLVLTSLGLVFTALAIMGIMGFRIYELTIVQRPFIWGITAFYMLLTAAGVLLMVSAALGNSTKLLKVFLGVSVVWTVIAFFTAHN